MALYCFFDHCYKYSGISIFGYDGLCLPIWIGTGKFRDQCYSGDTFSLFCIYSLLPERQDHHHHSVYKKKAGKKGSVALFLIKYFVVFNHHYRGSTFLGGIRCRYGFWRIFVLSASKQNYKNYCADNNPWIVFSDLYLFWWSKFCC